MQLPRTPDLVGITTVLARVLPDGDPEAGSPQSFDLVVGREAGMVNRVAIRVASPYEAQLQARAVQQLPVEAVCAAVLRRAPELHLPPAGWPVRLLHLDDARDIEDLPTVGRGSVNVTLADVPVRITVGYVHERHVLHPVSVDVVTTDVKALTARAWRALRIADLTNRAWRAEGCRRARQLDIAQGSYRTPLAAHPQAIPRMAAGGRPRRWSTTDSRLYTELWNGATGTQAERLQAVNKATGWSLSEDGSRDMRRRARRSLSHRGGSEAQ